MKTKYCLRCNKLLHKDDESYGQHNLCFQDIFQIGKSLEFESLARKTFSSSSSHQKIDDTNSHLTSYFAGNYKKYEGKLGGQSYIIKLSKEEYPELAPVEYVCNKIGYCCGIDVAKPFTLIEIAKNELAFVSKNFMHNKKTHTTLNAIYHYIEPGAKNYNVENLSHVIFSQTNSTQDVVMFFKTLLFDALIGNHDRHGRNFSFIETKNQIRLSPIYDNPSYLGLESGSLLNADFAVQGKVMTKHSEEPDIVDYASEIKRLKASRVVTDFFKNLNITQLLKLIQEPYYLSDNMKLALSKFITKQYKQLEDYVKNK